jgi:peptidoglycan/LPS O-acetylase OafA/YrhL
VGAISATATRGEGFRTDINGLRAWAVVAVVLYHFQVPGFAGGFAGVDVFFVISGFLMAGIVCGGLAGNRFALFSFYLARARRIWPALIVLVVVLLAVGWFLLMPREYQLLGKHARESLFFTSNLRYLAEAGYFDTASHEKWLLHTWSLSAEWQFYLLYPLVLLGLHKVFGGRRALVVAHVVGLLGSFAVCQYLSMREPSAAFFQLHSRAWELLLGGLVYLLGSQPNLSGRMRQWLEGLGAALILAAVFLLDASMRWPGTAVLLPTLGAALVLLASRQGSVLTGNPLAQWLGTRSYSIYLWHWPLVVLLVYFEQQHSPWWIGAGLAASLLLGHGSYHGVEVPARDWLAQKTKVRAAVWLVGSVVVFTVSAQMVRRSGFPDRLPAAVAQIEAERTNQNPRMDECLEQAKPCVFGGDRISAIVVGDSHADALVTAISASLPAKELGIYFKGMSACLIVLAAHPSGNSEVTDKCVRLKEGLIDELDRLYPGKPLIVINRTTFYALGELPIPGVESPGKPEVYFSQRVERPTPGFLQEFREQYVATACQLAAHRPLYLMRPVPEMNDSVPHLMGRALLLGKQVEPSITRAAYLERHALVWAAQDEAAARCGVHLLDPLPYLCDEQKCYGSRDGRPLYIDDDHLSEYGNRLLIPMFSKVLGQSQSSLAHGSAEQ